MQGSHNVMGLSGAMTQAGWAVAKPHGWNHEMYPPMEFLTLLLQLVLSLYHR